MWVREGDEGTETHPCSQAPSLGFSSPPYIPALIQLSLSLCAKMFPNHAAQLRATLHHRVQLRADGGVEEVGAKGQYGQAGGWGGSRVWV